MVYSKKFSTPSAALKSIDPALTLFAIPNPKPLRAYRILYPNPNPLHPKFDMYGTLYTINL